MGHVSLLSRAQRGRTRKPHSGAPRLHEAAFQRRGARCPRGEGRQGPRQRPCLGPSPSENSAGSRQLGFSRACF